MVIQVLNIFSVNKLAFLEGQSGRLFYIQELSGSDHLNCLNGISNFNPRSGAAFHCAALPQIFYTMEKSTSSLMLCDLMQSYFFVLCTLSKCTSYGNHTLTFQAKIVDAFADVMQKQAALHRVKSCHVSPQYNFLNVFKITAEIDEHQHQPLAGS